MPEIISQEQIKSSHSYFMTRSQHYTEMKPVILSGTWAIWSWTQKAPWIWCSEASLRFMPATHGLLSVIFRGQSSCVEGPGLPAECTEMGCVLEVCVCSPEEIRFICRQGNFEVSLCGHPLESRWRSGCRVGIS